MALFFDQEWFDARLKDRGATQSDIAQLLRLSSSEVSDLWKDQRELRAAEVIALAGFLGVSTADIANRAGVSTPTPPDARSVEEQLHDINDRLARIERMITELKLVVLSRKF
jgi:transcriptional regulator with XRE-family HTH domain